MNKIGLAKKRYNKAKRRIALGQSKPGDENLVKLLKEELGYKKRMPAMRVSVSAQEQVDINRVRELYHQRSLEARHINR